MLQWSRSISGEDEEHRRACHRYQIQRQKDDKFGNLAKGEGRVDSRDGGSAKLLHRIFAIGVDDARRRDQVCIAFIYEDGVKYIDQGFVDEKGFEEQGDDGCTFTKDEEGSIQPCQVAVEDCQKGDLSYFSICRLNILS